MQIPFTPVPLHVQPPLYAVLNRGPNGERNYPLQTFPAVGWFSIVLLTDDDLLDRYRRAEGVAEGKYETVKLDDWKQVLVHLIAGPKMATHVTIDPPERGDWTRFTYPIKSVIADIERLLDSHDDEHDPDGPPRDAAS